MAKDIAKLIHEKLKERSKNNYVQSSNIKQYVTEEFNSRNENVNADSYSGYSKCTIAVFSDNNKYGPKESHSQRSYDRERIKQKDIIGKE